MSLTGTDCVESEPDQPEGGRKEDRDRERFENALRAHGIPFKPNPKTAVWDYSWIDSVIHIHDFKRIRRWEADRKGMGNQEAFVHFEKDERHDGQTPQALCILNAVEFDNDAEIPYVIAVSDARVNDGGQMESVPNGRWEKGLFRYHKASENDWRLFTPDDVKNTLADNEQRSRFSPEEESKPRLSIARMLYYRPQTPMKLDNFVESYFKNRATLP